MKNNKLSLLDPNQVIISQHDDEHDAQRVIIVGGEGKQIAESIKESLKDSLKDIKIEVNNTSKAIDPLVIKIPYQTVVKEIEIKEVEKIIVVPEYRTVELPIIVPKVEMVEKQIIVPEYRVIETKVPVVSPLIKWILIIQTLAIVARLFFH